MNSGHRIGTAEVESALVSHPKCAEAAVVGIEHEVVACFLRVIINKSFIIFFQKISLFFHNRSKVSVYMHL